MSDEEDFLELSLGTQGNKARQHGVSRSSEPSSASIAEGSLREVDSQWNDEWEADMARSFASPWATEPPDSLEDKPSQAYIPSYDGMDLSSGLDWGMQRSPVSSHLSTKSAGKSEPSRNALELTFDDDVPRTLATDLGNMSVTDDLASLPDYSKPSSSRPHVHFDLDESLDLASSHDKAHVSDSENASGSNEATKVDEASLSEPVEAAETNMVSPNKPHAGDDIKISGETNSQMRSPSDHPEDQKQSIESFAESDPPPQYTEESTSAVLPEKSRPKGHYHQNSLGEFERIGGEDSGTSHLEDDDWQPMPTVGSYEMYDDANNLLQAVHVETDTSPDNAAMSGYTRVADNDETASINSLDDKTEFLFSRHTEKGEDNSDDDELDATAQMQTTKEMLTDQQRIAYVGLVRIILADMGDRLRRYGSNKGLPVESLQVWGSKLILKLYTHMELSNEEQLMIEQLAGHGVYADDLTPSLRIVQQVKDGKISAMATPNANVGDLHASTEAKESDNGALDIDVKWTAMCDLFLILVGDGVYDSRSRTLFEIAGKNLGATTLDVCQFERKVTEALQLDDSAEQDWTEQDIVETRRKKALRKKYVYMGLATIGGGLVIGLSSGLLAPVIGAGLAAGLTTIGITGTSSFLAGAGGIALVTTTGTAIGAGVSNRSMGRRMGHVKTFELRPIYNNRRVNTVVTVSGWMTGKHDDVRLPFSTIDPVVGDMMSVLWEPEMMRSLGQTINILATEALTQGVQQLLAATVLTALLSSLQLPMWLSKLSYILDNPWSVSLDRAWSAGQILADVLMQRNLGERPVTLVGFSLGARVIYSCLQELSKRNAYGLVQDVYLFGTPVFYSKKKFPGVRSVVSGRFVTAFSRRDWILAFLFPASRRYGTVLGQDPIPEADAVKYDIENVDVTELVDGHMAYRNKMPRLMKDAGWPVLSEEFEEIDDPDPDHIREKQRKLLSEIEGKPVRKKKGIWPWRRNKAWLEKAADGQTSSTSGENEEVDDEYLFDVDAIREAMRDVKPQLIFDAESEAPSAENPDPPPEYQRKDFNLPELEDEPAVPEEPLWHPSERAAVVADPRQQEAPRSQFKLTFDDSE